MKRLFAAAFIVAASVAQADVLLSPRGGEGPVIVELQPNAAFGSEMPAGCRNTFNYSTNATTVEQRPDTASTKDRAPCGRAWLENLVSFWNWFRSPKAS